MEKKIIVLQDDNGFLSKNHQKVVSSIYITYIDWFSLMEDVNNLIYRMYNDLSVKNNDNIGMYLLTAFSKAHKSFQSASILYQYGLEDEVHILFRTMLESLFISSSIKNDNSYFDKLLENQRIEDQRAKNHLIDIGCIKDKKVKINLKDKIGIKEFAQNSNFSKMYSAYMYLCTYTHVDLKNMEKNFDKQDGEVTGICIAPSANNLQFIIIELIALMLNYIEIIKDYLKVDYKNEIIKLQTRHSNLAKRVKVSFEKHD